MIYIIGSGLTAMAAAAALVRRGLRPTILDAGLSPDPQSIALKTRLAGSEPSGWSAEDLEWLKRTGPPAASGIPRKLYFGSDFSFRPVNAALPMDVTAASVQRSFAAGGFSNVWGAVIQEPSSNDLQDWPVTLKELAPHFAAVRALLGNMPGVGSVEHPLPVQASLQQLHPSSQAHALHADMMAGRKELEGEGIRFRPAQLAVRAAGPTGKEDCRYCGLCLHGCPYNCRYAAAETLASFLQAGRVEYCTGLVVDRFSTTNGSIQIEARPVDGGETRIFHGERVFVAAGLLETTRMILASLRLYDTPVLARHSDIFTLPLVRYRAALNISREKLHTLCQLVAEINDPGICSHPVHLQFYGYNDLYFRLLAQKTGRLAPLLAPALRAIAARLFVVFGYLHSSVSSSMTMILPKEGNGLLRIKGIPNPLAAPVATAAAKKLFRNRRHLRAIAFPLQLRLDLPGGGFHSGGTFPMRGIPKSLETDRWGCLPGLSGVHIVDASVLPAVPASPIAFTVMANAHRIASECPVPNVA